MAAGENVLSSLPATRSRVVVSVADLQWVVGAEAATAVAIVVVAVAQKLPLGYSCTFLDSSWDRPRPTTLPAATSRKKIRN